MPRDIDFRTGRVHLVGTGPGDPELLTLKALRLLRQADVVVHDRLVSPPIMELIPAGTRRVSVGKESGRHELPQDDINALLVRLARDGLEVVRLKGGDPFIFGRGGEEAAWLRANSIPVDVVPGITAATGCAAEMGIPLTHRGLATGVRFVTGHCRDAAPDLNWASMADPDTTLVIYMGLATLPDIAAQLIAHGLSPATPAMAVAGATTEARRQCRSTLAALPSDVAAARLRSPVLIVIGRVVALADDAHALLADIGVPVHG